MNTVATMDRTTYDVFHSKQYNGLGWRAPHPGGNARCRMRRRGGCRLKAGMMNSVQPDLACGKCVRKWKKLFEPHASEEGVTGSQDSLYLRSAIY